MAKRRVGTLSTKLTLNSASFQRGLRRARISLGKFATAIKNVSLRIVKFGAVIAAGAVAALTLMTRAQLKALDVVAKMSDRLNIATEDLIGLQHAANQLGTDTAQLNKGLELMNRRVGEAATGAGEAVDAFKLLRLDIAKMQRQDAAKNFGEIFDAINKLPNAFLKATTAADIFGRSGVGLLNLGAVGSVGLKRFREEAERLGIAFTRIDVAKVEAANDAMDRMKKVSSGLAGRFTVGISPLIEAFANFFTAENAREWGQIIQDSVKTVVISLARLLDRFKEFVAPFKAALRALTPDLSGFGGTPTGATGVLPPGQAARGRQNTRYRDAAGNVLKEFDAQGNLLWEQGRRGGARGIGGVPVHEPRHRPGGIEQGLLDIFAGSNRRASLTAFNMRIARGRGGQALGAEPAAAGAMARAPTIGFRTPGELGLVGGMPNVAAFGRSSPLVQITRTQAADIQAIRRVMEQSLFQGLFAGLR